MTDALVGTTQARPGVVENPRSYPEITVTLPPVYFPAPLHVHPQADLMQERGLAWMGKHGFLADPVVRQRVVDSRTGHFFAYVCPHGDVERMQVAVDWGYLMFVFDDGHCDQTIGGDNFPFLDLAARIIRTFEEPTVRVLKDSHPFTSAVVDLAERVHRVGSPRLVRRLTDAHTMWLFGVAWEIPAMHQQVRQTVNDYLFTRLMYVGAAPTIAWFQLANRDEIPDWEITAPRVRALTEMAGAVAAIDDDLYSYGKDLWFTVHRHGAAASRYHNLIDTYRTEMGMTQQDALEATVGLRDRVIHRFFDLCNGVLPGASSALECYLANLACLTRGNYEWGLQAGRFTNPDGAHPGAVRTVGTVTDTPMATGRPGIPCIDWWWD